MSRGKDHKLAFQAAKVQAELDKKHPEPMSFMHKRLKHPDLADTGMPYRKPEVTLGTQEKVGRAVADWDLSDPFTYGRAVLHVRQGYIRADETIKEMQQRTLARRAARQRQEFV